MITRVLLNLLNKLGKRDKMRGLPCIFSLFHNLFNKFNNIKARMSDSIYHMTFGLFDPKGRGRGLRAKYSLPCCCIPNFPLI